MSHEEFDRDKFKVNVPAEHYELVEVDGYEGRVYRVESYRIELNYYPAEQFSEIIYDLVDVVNNEYLEADAEDVTLLCYADQADEYMRTIDYENYPKPTDISKWTLDITQLMGGNDMFAKKPEQPRKPTARELSAQVAEERKQARKARAEQIDNLLDQRNWYAEQLAKTNDEAYGDRVMAIDAELKKLTEADV